MAWLDDRFRKRIRFDISNSGGVQTECPVSIPIDTQNLIANEGMLDDGRDIRFAGADEVTLLPFAVLSGLDTADTKIGVRVDSIPNGTSSIYMYFDYICGSINNLSDGSFWYSSVATAGSPELTTSQSDITVRLDTGGSGGTGTAVERFSPTFNALNVSRFDFDISAGNTGNTGGCAEHWINITAGAEIFYRQWASADYMGYPFWDPWDTTAMYDASGLTGVHELNMLLHVDYCFFGTHHNVTDVVTIILSNDASIGVAAQPQEDCPTPIPTNTWYVKPDGNDAADGTSWANAWATLTHASTNAPADNGDIVRIGEGAYMLGGGFAPNVCTNWVGGYYDGSWHDWTEGCGHDRPEITNSGSGLLNDDVSFGNIGIDASVAPLAFPNFPAGYLYRFTNCRYEGMIFAGASIVTFTNTDHIFHDPTGTPLPGLVTPVYHEFVVQMSGAQFNTLTPRIARITPDADINMLITSWGTSGDQNKQWTVEAAGARTITFQLADMLPDTKYDLLVDGAKVSSAVSDGSGVIAFPAYSGTFSEKVFETEVSSGSVPIVMIF